MKLIFVTGGVISGLGKGITASSIGKLLKDAGYSVSIMKMDPYLQIDAGTMSPYEHWEVFVTDDGWESDLDLWHYERFIDEDLTKDCSVTTWQIYSSVIEKERRWEYLWQTVQVIPHIIDEVKSRIYQVAQDKDVTIIEIWGTVWDIEWPHFLETMRQLKHELWRENVIYVHVAPLLKVTTSWEPKSKAIQHSVIKLRELWIQPNFLVCRTTDPIDDSIKRKLSLFCDLDPEYIIEARDRRSIYQVPLSFQKQGFDGLIQKHFWGKSKKSNLWNWKKLVDKVVDPKNKINIWIAGKYTQLDDCYLSVLEALKHAGAHYDTKVNIEWIDTEKYQGKDWKKQCKEILNKVDWILVPWGFGDRGVEWMINIANCARENKVPYLGICLGLQVAVMSFARNVCGIPKANSSEFCTGCEHAVVDIMEEQKAITCKWGTMRLGAYPAILKKGTKTYELYWKGQISERHRHRYEVNTEYHKILEEKWLVISGLSPNGMLVEFVELPNHPYYVATQAHPELKSRLNKPHPLFLGLVKASLDTKK